MFTSLQIIQLEKYDERTKGKRSVKSSVQGPNQGTS